MKKVTTLILIFATAIISAQSLSFNEAVTKLRGGNKKLQGMKKQEESKVFAAKSTEGLYYPELTLNASHVYMADHIYLDFNDKKAGVEGMLAQYKPMVNGVKASLAPFAALPQLQKFMGAASKLGAKGKQLLAKDWKFKIQDQQITKVSVDLKYPIFTGGKIKTGVKLKKLQAKIAKVETEKIEGILIAELAERYFQTMLAEEGIKIREQALEAAKKHLYIATKMEENGMLAPIQTMLAKSAVADAERELLGIKKDAELAKTALKGLLGGTEGDVDLTTTLFNIKDLMPLKHYQNLAKENYPDIVKAGIQKELTEQNIKFQKGHYYPDVAIVGKKYLYTKNLPLTEPDNWYLGIGMKMDIFDGFKTKKKVQEAKAMNEGVNLMIAQAKIDIQTLVKKYYIQIQKQQEQLVSLEKSVTFSDELVRVRTKAFKENFATSTDVADANLYLASIKIKRLKSLFEIDKNLAKLLEICGASDTYTNYTAL